MADPALLEPGGVLLRHLRRDRGHVDEHGTALHRICCPAVEEHLAHDWPAVEDGEDVVGALNAVDRAVGDPRAHDASAQKGDVVSHWRVPTAASAMAPAITRAVTDTLVPRPLFAEWVNIREEISNGSTRPVAAANSTPMSDMPRFCCKVPKCRATNFPLKDETSGKRQSM